MPAKYRHVADSIARRIQVGEIGHGGRLPAELDLARAYDVSRGTVRQALSSLQRAGLIETLNGAGSFVCYDGACLNDQLGWSRALSERGVQTRTSILRFECMDDAGLAGELEIADILFLALDRVRSTQDGEPISLERSRLPWRRDHSTILRHGLVEGSLRRTLEAQGIHPVGGTEAVKVARLSATEAALLARPPGDAFLATRRISYDAAGTTIECVDSLLHPQHFRLHFGFGALRP